MIPAEIMAKAAWKYAWSGLSEQQKKRSIEDMRNALRALAEMEPTEMMRKIAHGSLDKTPIKDCEQQGLQAWKWITVAAAEEGEDLGRDGPPSSTETKC